MKRFLLERLNEYEKYLNEDLPILERSGEETQLLNFNFGDNSSEFLSLCEGQEAREDAVGEVEESNLLKTKFGAKLNVSLQESQLIDSMKLGDSDIEHFLEVLGSNQQFKGELVFSQHNLTDQTAIRIAKILSKDSPKILGIALNEIQAFTYIAGQNIGDALPKNHSLRKIHLHNAKLGTSGANRVIEAIKLNKSIEDYDLGQLTNESLEYLTRHLSFDHSVTNISFGEDASSHWNEATKHRFIKSLRMNSFNKQLQSIDVYSERLEENQTFIAEIAILCQNNRRACITLKNNEYKSKELNTSHSEYYHGDNHPKNAFQFSVKTYMSNVIETLLDEGLYYLEKERANITRDELIFDINKEHVNKHILDDIFKAEGSLLILARYMINKVEKRG